MFEIISVSLIVLIALYLFVTEKFSVDVTALLILSLLIISGLLTTEESLVGFSSPATITIAAMFIISGALNKTGVVNLIGTKISQFADRPKVFTVVLSSLVGVISAFINNTATVAVFLPTVLGVCKKKKLSPAKFLIPLSYASQFGGVCTLIGTSTNLLVSAIAVGNGLEPFSLFEFAKLGIILFVAGVLYFLIFGKYVLPNHEINELSESYGLGKYITELRVDENSPLIGKTLIESDLGKNYDLSVFEIYQGKNKVVNLAKHQISAGDTLLAGAHIDNLLDLQQNLKLKSATDFKFNEDNFKDKEDTLVETIIAPNSNLVGKNLMDANFKKRFNAIVVAIRRRDSVLRTQLRSVRLQMGDELLLLLPKSEIAFLSNSNNLILLAEKADLNPNQNKLLLSLGIVAAVILATTFGLFSILEASIIGCLAMIVTNCISIEEAYLAIEWKVIIMLAGILPLGVALEKSGVIDIIVDNAFGVIGDLGPIFFLAGIYLLTAVLTEVISNNAAAVLLAPLAITTASTLGASPYPFLVAVCFAASTSFSTPVGYQTNTMIYSPGNYKFSDFMRAGIPLNIIFWILAVIFIPVFWPF